MQQLWLSEVLREDNWYQWPDRQATKELFSVGELFVRDILTHTLNFKQLNINLYVESDNFHQFGMPTLDMTEIEIVKIIIVQ